MTNFLFCSTVVREEDFDPNKQVFPVDHEYPIWVFGK